MPFFLIVLVGSVNAAVLVEENQHSVTIKSASTSEEYRTQRRFGVGLGTAGLQGLIGVLAEINFTANDAIAISFGLGNEYQTFGAKYKYSLGGAWFSPYFSMSLSRWYTAGNAKGEINKTSPSFLSKRFLSDREKQEGRFAETLLSPSMGLQYNQLKGPWAGSSIYAEVVMIFDLDDFVSAPTGEIGYIRYF